MSRRIIPVGRGAVRVEQRTRLARARLGTDVSGPACVYARVRVVRGSLAYLHGRARIPAPRCFSLFLPPFSVAQASLERCDVFSTGLAFRLPPTETCPSRPMLLAASPDDPLPSPENVLNGLRAIEQGILISRECGPPPVAVTAKTILDAEYRTPLAIGTVANRARVSPAILSRVFKEAYGMPPVRYRHQLRIMDALMRLADGEVPAEVFLDVGFEDLSRFYKIFHQVACAAPGAYRAARSRNAKT